MRARPVLPAQHIPKTAGSAIEEAALRVGVRWGLKASEELRGQLRYRHEARWLDVCERYDQFTTASAHPTGPCGVNFYGYLNAFDDEHIFRLQQKDEEGAMPWLSDPRCCSWWHVPPAWQPSRDPRPYCTPLPAPDACSRLRPLTRLCGLRQTARRGTASAWCASRSAASSHTTCGRTWGG